jgi:uncharacterized protein (DUF302 family)
VGRVSLAVPDGSDGVKVSTMSPLALTRELSRGFEQTLEALPAALATESFGILTEIDVTGVFAKKLEVPFRRYRIFGACNPNLAKRALDATLVAGVMLPCNIVVWERDDGGTTVATVDPRVHPLVQSHPAMVELAEDVVARLERVLGKLEV